MRASRAWPIARARQARQALSVAVVTAASVKRRLLMSVIGASLVKEAQTRVLMIACCEPQMTATALSASRAGSRPAMQPAVAASSLRISTVRALVASLLGGTQRTVHRSYSWIIAVEAGPAHAHGLSCSPATPLASAAAAAFWFQASILPVPPRPSFCFALVAISVRCIASPASPSLATDFLSGPWTSTRQRRVGYAGHPWRAVEAWGDPLHPPRP